MKKKQEIKPVNFKKYFMPTTNQLVKRTQNFHALVLIGTLGIYFGLYKLIEYGMNNHFYEPDGMWGNLILVFATCFLTWLFIYILSQAFDISLKLNYNALEQSRKVPIFNFKHGWRSSLTNSLYYLNTIVLGYLVYTIVNFVNARTFNFKESAISDPDYYYYDKSDLQQFFDSHSGAALAIALLFLFLVSMVTTVFSSINAQISYGNKSGLESSIRALRGLSRRVWMGIAAMRFVYAFLVLSVCYLGYIIYDYFGDFGLFAGPGIVLVCFYFLYPYVVTLHTGYYYRYNEEMKDTG